MPPDSPNTVNQTVDYGGITWKGQPGGGWTAQTSTGGGALPGASGSSYDPVETAKKMLEFQKTANVPVVQALQGQTSSIKDKYTELVNSIKGNQQVSENQANLVSNNQLAARGIASDTGYGMQNMQQNLLPVQSAYSGQLANVGAGSIQDLNALALQIAQYQAGNPDTAMSQSFQYGGLQQQAAALAQQQFLGTSPTALGGAQAGYYGALGSLLGGANRLTLKALTNGVGVTNTGGETIAMNTVNPSRIIAGYGLSNNIA